MQTKTMDIFNNSGSRGFNKDAGVGDDNDRNNFSDSVLEDDGQMTRSLRAAINNLKDCERSYNKSFKKVFSKKRFLSPILQNVVPEYKNLSLIDIEGLIVSDEGSECAKELNPRDLGKDYEKDIEHDLLFEINVPEDEATVMVRLDFDLEMQRKYRPGYKMPKRGIYYCSRMISRQITDKDFEDAKNNSDYVDYDKLRHVYSVWICLNEVPQGLQNSVVLIQPRGSVLSGSPKPGWFQREIGYANLFSLVFIYLNNSGEVDDDTSDLLRYLYAVFAEKECLPDNPYCENFEDIREEVLAMNRSFLAYRDADMEREIAEGIKKREREFDQKERELAKWAKEFADEVKRKEKELADKAKRKEKELADEAKRKEKELADEAKRKEKELAERERKLAEREKLLREREGLVGKKMG